MTLTKAYLKVNTIETGRLAESTHSIRLRKTKTVQEDMKMSMACEREKLRY